MKESAKQKISYENGIEYTHKWDERKFSGIKSDKYLVNEIKGACYTDNGISRSVNISVKRKVTKPLYR